MKKFDLKNLQGSKRTLRSGSYATVLAVVVLAFVIRFNVLDGGHDRIGIVYYLRLMVLVIPFYFLLYQYITSIPA